MIGRCPPRAARVLVCVLLATMVLPPRLVVHAGQYQAPCPPSTPPSTNPPSSTVVVTILSVDPETDLEGDDDNVPFYDNRADIYGTVVIDGQEFELPTIEDNDHPHWDGGRGQFQKMVASSPTKITIRIRESDGGVTGDDDVVDINPSPGKKDLEFTVDLCSLQAYGDVNGGIQQVFEVDGGSGIENATIRFQVALADGRPVSTDDLAIVDVDLVQVIFHADRLAADKPTIAMVRIANNFALPISTTLRLTISAPGFHRDDTFTIDPPLGGGEVRKLYFYRDNPLRLPASLSPSQVVVHAAIDPAGIHNGNIPWTDCRIQNNMSPRTHLTVVTTGRHPLGWASVGTLIDIPELVSSEKRAEVRDLSMPFINAVYPALMTGYDWPVPIVPPVSAALDWLVTVLAAFGIPADTVLPYWLVFELNGVAILTGTNRLMGTLPNNWFERFVNAKVSTVSGLSLGEFAPHAVVFNARGWTEQTVPGSDLTVPGHELGHTFGLSVDSRVRTSWMCEVDWPIFGDLPCGAMGGWDETSHADPILQLGNPSSGYWITQGGEPAAILPLVDQEQCDSKCFMGNWYLGDRHLRWPVEKLWIDRPDYTRLLDALKPGLLPPPPPAPPAPVVYVSGMIAANDQFYFGPVYQFPAGVPDHDETSEKGFYGLRFVGAGGGTLLEMGIPVSHSTALGQPVPVTFFGFLAPFPNGTQRIQIWNRREQRLLGEATISPNAPSIQLTYPSSVDEQTFSASVPWDIRWRSQDADSGATTTTILMSSNGEEWWPLVLRTAGSEYRVAAGTVAPGRYFLKLVVNDESHARETAPARVRIVN